MLSAIIWTPAAQSCAAATSLGLLESTRIFAGYTREITCRLCACHAAKCAVASSMALASLNDIEHSSGNGWPPSIEDEVLRVFARLVMNLWNLTARIAVMSERL
eukprot:6204227-Pleurochrysis_carterae.AAC.2